jgi:hypothetical protein
VKKIIALGIGLLLSFPVHSQAFLSTRSAALAGADLTSSESVLSATANPAILTGLAAPALEVAYAPAPFELNELRTLSAALEMPVPCGAMSLSFQKYGFDLYSETQLQLGFAAQVLDSLSAGVSVTGYSLSIKGYGEDFTLLFNMGFCFPIERHLRFAFSFCNFTDASLGPGKNKLPTSLRGGITYAVPELLKCSFGLEKETGFETTISTGIALSLTEYFELLCGYKVDPGIVSAGISIPYDRVTFVYSVQHHPELGYTHTGGISLRFSPK